MPPLGIRFRLTALFVSGFALLLVISAVSLFAVIDRHHRDDFDDRLVSASVTAQRLYDLSRPRFDDPDATIRHVIDELSFAEKTLVAFDSTGARVARSRRIEGAPNLDDLTPFSGFETREVRLRAGHFRVLHRSMGDGLDLYVGRDLTPMQEESAWLRLLFAVGLPIILAGGTIIGLWGARLALNPIVAVARAADRVGTEVAAGAEQFTPLPQQEGKDEIATLTTACNRLIARLAEALWHERGLAEKERQLLADTAHEIRTPVAILQSSAEVALTSARTNEEYRNTIESIAKESRALGALINDLLLFSRRDAQGAVQVAASMYLDDAVSHCLERIRDLPEARGRRIQIGELDAAPVHADSILIERAVLALVHNALVHAPSSSIEVSTGVLNGQDRPESWVRVRDWGPGIPAEQHETIFRRFTRLENDKPGTGLGLSIVQLIAEASGGRVVLESRPGAGATFTLLLPAATT